MLSSFGAVFDDSTKLYDSYRVGLLSTTIVLYNTAYVNSPDVNSIRNIFCVAWFYTLWFDHQGIVINVSHATEARWRSQEGAHARILRR